MKRASGVMSLLTLAGASASSMGQGQSAIRLIDRIDHAASRLTAGFEGDEVVSLRAATSSPVPAFARGVGLAPDSVATVRVRVRLEGERRVPVRLEVGALRRAPASPEAEITSSDRIGLEPGIADPPVRVVDGCAADEWQDLEMFVGSRPGRRGISIAISAVGDSFTVEKCEVSEPPAWQRTLVGPRLPQDAARDTWRRFVKLDDETMESVILGAGDRLRWRLVVPAVPARLHASVAMVGPPPPPDAVWRVAVDGQPLKSQPLSASGPGFTPWSADLSEFAGREVELALDAPPKFDGAVVIGAPMIVATDPARTNLVLICIDTLRADQIGCHGAVPSLTPAMDALAAAGTRFSRFVAASSWTLPSHATFFSGQEPLVHGANRIGGRVGPDRTPLLARELATAGWVTGAFTGGGFLDPAFGLATGFDHYSVRDPGRLPIGKKGASFDPMAPAIAWLERHADEPFFLFVHSYVVHDYAPSDAYLARVPSPATAELFARDSIKVRLEFGAGDAARKPAIERLYRAALLQADELIVARMLRELEARKIDGRTIVGIISDHGDQWLEHDGIFHGEELWRELVEVPCILRGAAIPVGAVRDEPVGHLDLAPTLLAQLRIDRPGAMRGRDLFGESFEPEPVLSLVHGESGVVVEAVTAWPWRLIRRHVLEGADPECHLFRIDLDRLEQRNLAAAEPARLDALQRWLDAKLLECARASLGESPSGTVDSDLARRLKELGYGNR